MRKSAFTLTSVALIICGLSGAVDARGAERDASLKILSPDHERLGEPRKQPLPPVDARAFFFKEQPTREYGARLNALSARLEEKKNYQVLDQHDLLDAQSENHQIALQYLRAILRSKAHEWIHASREYLKKEREHREIQARALESRPAGREIASLRDDFEALQSEEGGAAAEAARADDEARKAEAEESVVAKFLFRATRFFERLTNDGVTAQTPVGPALFRVDPQSTFATAALRTPVVGAGMAWRLRPADRPLPFSGGPGDPNEERLTFSGATAVPGTGVTAAVGYRYLHRSLSCDLSRAIVGGLTAHVSRNWEYGVAARPEGRVNSLAEVSYSVVF